MTISLKELKELASRATPGPWDLNTRWEDSTRISVWLSYGPHAVGTDDDFEFQRAANPATILRLIEVIGIQKEALEFYANPDHIEDDSDVEEIVMDQGDFDEHEFRLGKISREALAKAEEILNG